MEQQEVKGDAITPESNPIAYTLSVTTPDEVVAVVNNPEIKPHARPTYELTRNVFFVGFMAAVTTRGMPVVMPPSRPPALLDARVNSAFARSSKMGSCTCEPGLRAASKPMPNSTPLMAGMLNRAPPMVDVRRSVGTA